MKTHFTVFFLLIISNFVNAQKRSILESTNILAIETYIKKDRSNNSFLISTLKNKIRSLKRKEKARLRLEEIKKARALAKKNAAKKTDAEFASLMKTKGKNHSQKTVKLLNTLFDNDPTSDTSILLIENKSKCNLVLHIKGKNSYKMAVPFDNKDLITIKKGDYQLSGKVCKKRYFTNKSLYQNTRIILQ